MVLKLYFKPYFCIIFKPCSMVLKLDFKPYILSSDVVEMQVQMKHLGEVREKENKHFQQTNGFPCIVTVSLASICVQHTAGPTAKDAPACTSRI